MSEYIENIQSVEWISVDECLPEQNEQVLIVWVNRNPAPYCKQFKNIPFVSSGVYFNNRWFWWDSTIEDILAEYGDRFVDPVDNAIEVTHWMPLPLPPEVKDDKG